MPGRPIAVLTTVMYVIPCDSRLDARKIIKALWDGFGFILFDCLLFNALGLSVHLIEVVLISTQS